MTSVGFVCEMSKDMRAKMLKALFMAADERARVTGQDHLVSLVWKLERLLADLRSDAVCARGNGRKEALQFYLYACRLLGEGADEV